jgi:cytochrome P450
MDQCPMDQLPFTTNSDALDIAPRYRTLQEEQPITRVRTRAGDPAWLVTRHADVMALFADDRLGRSHPDPARAARISASVLLGGPTGERDDEHAQHRRKRRLLTPAFSARRMQALRERVGSQVEGLLDELPAPPVDLHAALSVPLPVMVICELLGVPYRDHDRFRAWSTDLASLTDPAASGAGRRELVEYMHGLIAVKREAPGADVISDLLAAQDDQGLTDDDIADTAAMLLFAGHETTVVRIDFGVLLLISHPDQRDALRGDPGLIGPAVEEVLRLSSSNNSVGGLPRYAHADITIHGVTIAAGDAVLLAPGVANRDPRAFPDPDTFDIARTPNPHLTFGHGARYCIGASLARVELQEVFGRIVHRLPNLRLAVPRHELRLQHDRLTGGLAELPVAW